MRLLDAFLAFDRRSGAARLADRTSATEAISPAGRRITIIRA